jgi:hypothetical protein
LWRWMGMNFFPSRSRHCPQCSQRKITVKGEQLIEYYHRGVVCHLIGLNLAVPMDVEMILPGEGEVAAAMRLLGRVFATYGRLIQAVVADALYMEAPFFNFCLSHGKHLIAVLKGEHRLLLQDAQGLFQMAKPQLWKERNRTVMLWDDEGFDSAEGIERPLRVLHAQEAPSDPKKQTVHWWWATTIPSTTMSGRQLWQAAHHRWDIENDAFNTLGTHWNLNHCFKHHPSAILNFILTLFITYVLLQSFYHRNIKPELRYLFTLIGISSQLYLGLDVSDILSPLPADQLRAPPPGKV